MTRIPLPSPDDPKTNTLMHRVYYGETDQMGWVYYGNYPAWFEQGRAELFRDLGLPYHALEKQGVRLPVRSCLVRYQKPAKYDDLIRIVTAISRLRRASIVFLSAVYNEQDELLAEGKVELACVTAEGSPTPFPAEFREFLKGQVLGDMG